jgi:hypothetical protein
LIEQLDVMEKSATKAITCWHEKNAKTVVELMVIHKIDVWCSLLFCSLIDFEEIHLSASRD